MSNDGSVLPAANETATHPSPASLKSPDDSEYEGVPSRIQRRY